MRVLLTGGTGFIGSHAVEHFLSTTDWELVLLEGLNYASSVKRLEDMALWPKEHGRVRMLFHDLRAPLSQDVRQRLDGVDGVVHFAAETHVDRSLIDPLPFVQTNVLGTYHLLEWARATGIKFYVQVSTDEVYGPAPEGVAFGEEDRLKPSNPYAATKAAADCLAYSYWVSFKVPVMITRTMNNFGERQHIEKFVPKTVRALLAGRPVTIHGTPGNVGSRCWLHARNHADAVKFLIEQHFIPGETFHVSSDDELTNLQMAEHIATAMNLSLDGHVEYIDFHACRPGHDRRYALSGEKLRQAGWRPPVAFEESLHKTVRWMVKHTEWLMLGKT